MWPFLALALSCELVVAAYSSFRRGMESAGKREYQVQHGACSYTFLLPEVAECRPPAGAYVSNSVQRDAPLDYDDSVQRLQVLENIRSRREVVMKLKGFLGDPMPGFQGP